MEMNVNIFLEKYAFSGKPIQVKNVTNNWKAMTTFNFEFFRDLYMDLQNSENLEHEHCIAVRMAFLSSIFCYYFLLSNDKSLRNPSNPANTYQIQSLRNKFIF